MTEDGPAAPQAPRRGFTERLLGAPAEPTAPRPARERPAVPRSLRWAAVVVGVEALACVAAAVVLVVLLAVSTASSASGAVAEVVVALLAAAGLAACAAGLWRVSLWSRGPVIACQLLLAALGYTAAFQYATPQFGLPALALVAVELYLLATPESRLAFTPR